MEGSKKGTEDAAGLNHGRVINVSSAGGGIRRTSLLRAWIGTSHVVLFWFSLGSGAGSDKGLCYTFTPYS